MHTARAWLAAAAVAALAGCGGTSGGSSRAERQWAASAADVIDQLRQDVDATTIGGDTVVAARRAMRTESELYPILAAYTDFAGCRHMVATIGAAGPSDRQAERTLGLACARLERASSLFSQAERASSPRALVAATRLSLGAAALLAEARAELPGQPG